MCTISYWHYGNITWGSLLLLTSKANERFKLQRLLCLLALILSRANSSLWHTLGVKNISPSSCSLVSPHSIPFPFTPSSSRHWKGAKKNVDPDSPESDATLAAGPRIWRGSAELWLAARSCTSHTWQNLLMQNLERAPLEDWGNLSMILLFKKTSTLSVPESPRRQSNRIYLQRGKTCLMCLLVSHQRVKLFSEPPEKGN